MTHTSYNTYLAACRGGLRAAVRLGSPRLRNCSGLGICDLQLTGAGTALPGCRNCLPAYLRLDPPTGRLLLHLERAGVTPLIRRRYLADGWLSLPEAYALPAPVIDALGAVDGPHRIEAGRYPILEDDCFLTVSLRLARESPGLLRSAA